MSITSRLRPRLEPPARRFAKNVLSSRALQPYYRRVGRKFGRVFHNGSYRTWEGNMWWMGVGTEKLPLDAWIVQEIIYETKPTTLIETGVRRGGSALYYAHLFDILGEGRVLGIDIDLSLVHESVREHPRVTLLETDSAGEEAVRAAREAADGQRTMVILDSDHSAQHVRRELDALGGLVSPGCYLIVEDTNLRSHPMLWVPDPSPAVAIDEWLPLHPEFEVDRAREKFLATWHPGGYLVRRPESAAA
jgi:cephalosporin hydroxylase